ncbi:MAG: glycosyltransferase family 9 protein [Bacteroidales bacterium]|nr:glycosyltransferase family 9 protein [Bacteroidales bacterium]
MKKNLTKNIEMRFLVIRTSSMGDVALAAPVITEILKQYPQIEITLVTQSAFGSFFRSIRNLQLFYPDFKKRHKGLYGLFRLFRDIKKQYRIDYVIDLHDVLRSKFLRWFFKLTGVPVAVIDKGRTEKRQVIKGKKKIHLKHTVERYYDVFARAGFSVQPEDGPWIIPATEKQGEISALLGAPGILNIGVAPYAKHALKMWPEENMVRLLNLISEKLKVKFWLFGGIDEYERLVAFQSKVISSSVVAGKHGLDEELTLISKLDFMITMDSANMHMASLVGTRVISIWGGTDPLTGFGAWKQPDDYSIRIPVSELTCRPCTIYGKGRCRRGDLACMNWLTPEKVFEKLVNLKIV